MAERLHAITQRSTSPLMVKLFKEDIEIVGDVYREHISTLMKEYPHFKATLEECADRTGFLLPYMCVEYGYFSNKNDFLPDSAKTLAGSFGLVVLAVCVEDDVVDEFAGDMRRMIDSVSVAELLQHRAYSTLFGSAEMAEAHVVSQEIGNFLRVVTRFQHIDAINIDAFLKRGFDLGEYLETTYKTGSIINVGLNLGAILAGERNLEPMNALGKYLGQVLQLIDDLLDLEDDLTAYNQPVTLPMYLKMNRQNFDQVFELIQQALGKGAMAAKDIQYPEKVYQLVEGFDIVQRELQRKFL